MTNIPPDDPIDATARPIFSPVTGSLESVEITAAHPVYGEATIALTPDQIECLHARLGQISFAATHGMPVSAVGSCRLATGAEAVAVTEIEGERISLQAVAIQRGKATVYLEPEHADSTRRALEQIAIAHRRRRAVGGEDPREA